jgi:ATP-dependent Zn protease
LQIHPYKTPLADDVDFRKLSETYAASGGDIKNAVIKAAAAAAAEPGPDSSKRIAQRHFEAAMEEVMAARSIMQQSVFKEVQLTLPMQPADARVWIAALVALALATVAIAVSVVAIWLIYSR